MQHVVRIVNLIYLAKTLQLIWCVTCITSRSFSINILLKYFTQRWWPYLPTILSIHRHHVDASYYGAEQTGFLKHKRGRINQRSGVASNVSPPYLTPVVTTNDAFDPLEEIKQEVVPLKLVRCDRSDEDVNGDEDTRSAHEYQGPTASMSSPSQHTPSTEGSNEDISCGYIIDTHHSNEEEAISKQLFLDNPHFKEKLKAETRYYNEMAELARAKRIMIELQSKKLMLEMETMRSS
ncbi:uncharacterized protein [Bactrocera oleae]|uniref:uncharacterized protein isoform X1 n=1 Tax=Bactrocera oleae TaxID=104688 RepID=UPI00387E3E95